ncbi:preprotein translocase subunit SecG [Nitrospina watsonii]|uniref:Protein-export membrane protein SecG n=1 Tax=Nitrospina watsonii TaxID=1323948 RepID=A0ABN8W1K8_9BACT|nr:preprotein translocase subunit SecG [Nitrospina watsonii]CAI2718410.1 Protein-export membrane protein SecG [Nitrospina watsonii]
MHTFVTVLHIAAAVFLILVVLLQSGKGAAMGAVFGSGSSQTMFGSSGAGNFLTKLTTAAAVIFMLTSLSLATVLVDRKQDSVINEMEETTTTIPTNKPAQDESSK